MVSVPFHLRCDRWLTAYRSDQIRDVNLQQRDIPQYEEKA